MLVEKTHIANYTPWVVCFLASLYFFYEIVQLTVFNTISSDLIKSFALSSTQLGAISASYFYACALSLLPAGLILDRFPAKLVLTIACGLCTLGVWILATSQLVEMMVVGRILTGVGNAFAFLGAMRLASRWFSGQKIALVMGFSVTIGMLGGVISQAPFMLLVDFFGWRSAMYFNAVMGIIMTVTLFLWIYDRPIQSSSKLASGKSMLLSLIVDLKLSASNLQNWLCGLYTGLLNLPVMILGALWGNTYLIQEKNIAVNQAASITSLIFFGLIIGAPLLGWITDKFKERYTVMILSALLSLITVLSIMYLPLHFLSFCGLFFIMGILSGAQTLSYPIVSENNPGALESACLGLVAVIVNVIAALLQSLFGGLIESSYEMAMLILPIGFSVSLIIAVVIRCYCQKSKNSSI
jgi:MFS family permease